ncbi:hypothetical protein ACOMHN_006352 [Nucella lapillus]
MKYHCQPQSLRMRELCSVCRERHYMGSPQRISSSTPEESGHFEIRDPDDGSPQDNSSCKEAVPEGTTPSISSCASSQRTGDSDLSPGPEGLRVSEWARQMKWETTPTKQEPITPPHQADSGKKRKKFAKGGLAEQMCRILQREKSARSVWQHQHKPEASAQGAGSKGVVVRVRHLETAYGVKLTRCTVLASPASVHLSTNVQFSVLFSSPSAKQKAVIKQGATVHIFPPWQQVDTAGGGALLCTRYHVRGHSSGRDRSGGGGGGVSDGDTNAAVSGLASSPAVSGLTSSPVVTHGRWMCPCSADTSLPATKCPAYLFPFLPSSITQAPTAALSSEPSTTGKALQTVTLSEGAPKRTLTFSTLLESIERAPSGDRLLPPFQATVLRVFQEQGEAQSLRHCVLVEDSQGTVAMVSGATQLSPHLEGCLCLFSCLRVHSRTNADRDPALFSAVCGAWSDRGKTTAAPSTSQDSDSVSHSDHSQLASRPPGFCYLLEVDPGACSVVEGGDWLTVSSSPSTSSPPPLMLTSLAEALQSQKQGRISVLSKFLYFSSKQSEKEEMSRKSSNQNSSQTPAVLYITDHSLQKRHIVDSEDSPVKQDKDLATTPAQGLEEERKLPAFVRVDVRAECVTRDMARENARSKKSGPALVLLRDVWSMGNTVDVRSMGNTVHVRSMGNTVDVRFMGNTVHVSGPWDHCSCVRAMGNTVHVSGPWGTLFMCQVHGEHCSCQVHGEHCSCVRFMGNTVHVSGPWGTLFMCQDHGEHCSCVRTMGNTVHVSGPWGTLFMCQGHGEHCSCVRSMGNTVHVRSMGNTVHVRSMGNNVHVRSIGSLFMSGLWGTLFMCQVHGEHCSCVRAMGNTVHVSGPWGTLFMCQVHGEHCSCQVHGEHCSCEVHGEQCSCEVHWITVHVRSMGNTVHVSGPWGTLFMCEGHGEHCSCVRAMGNTVHVRSMGNTVHVSGPWGTLFMCQGNGEHCSCVRAMGNTVHVSGPWGTLFMCQVQGEHCSCVRSMGNTVHVRSMGNTVHVRSMGNTVHVRAMGNTVHVSGPWGTLFMSGPWGTLFMCQLQQSTIEELLPDEEEEEGYEVDCVLNKAVGPVNCILTSTTPSATGLTMTAVQLPC